MGVKVAAALRAAHGKPGKAVFKYLFKAEELNYRLVNGRMETKPALIWADCRIKLSAIAAVYLNLSGIVNPRNAELNETLRLGNTFHNCVLLNFGMLRNHRLKRGENFAHRLKELLLTGVSFFKVFIYLFKIFAFE